MAEASASEVCGWCPDEAATHVIVVPGKKNRKTAPVCEKHAADFERRGTMTVRLEVEQKLERERKRNHWKVTRTWR